MKLIRLLLLAAGAAYAYKRFFADAGAGTAETAAAEPFSSEQLEDQPDFAADAAPIPAEPDRPQPSKDTLEQPTWLDPADAAPADAAPADAAPADAGS
jgi:hypothetical protein